MSETRIFFLRLQIFIQLSPSFSTYGFYYRVINTKLHKEEREKKKKKRRVDADKLIMQTQVE